MSTPDWWHLDHASGSKEMSDDMTTPRKTKTVKIDPERVRSLRDQCSKLRHWLSGFQDGTGKAVPNADALRQACLFMDDLLK